MYLDSTYDYYICMNIYVCICLDNKGIGTCSSYKNGAFKEFSWLPLHALLTIFSSEATL